jgi:tetratricopeptide (TPR) repeat protein
MAVDAKINFAQSLMKLASIDRADEGVLKATSSSSSSSPSSSSLQTSAQILATAVQQAESLQDKRAESYALGTLGNLYEINQQFTDAQKLTEKALFLAQSIHASDIVYQWQWQLGRIRRQQGDIKGAVPYYSEAFKTLQDST